MHAAADQIPKEETNEMKTNKIIPIFYICDDSNASSTITSLRSIFDKGDKSYSYNVCILHGGLDKSNVTKMLEFEKNGFNVTLEDISCYTKNGGSEAISFSSDFIRAFIPEMFPGFDRSILVKNDYVASEDICRYFENPAINSSLFKIGC